MRNRLIFFSVLGGLLLFAALATSKAVSPACRDCLHINKQACMITNGPGSALFCADQALAFCTSVGACP